MAQGVADWPQKPVRILTPFPGGRGPEVVLRMVADRLQKMWGKPVVVETARAATASSPSAR
jgi:tripartite-type tricarboxylate transporter receptor subunit TctC